MHRLLLLLAVAVPAAAVAAPSDPQLGGTPAWLPRAAFAGTYVNGGAVTPQLRLQWEVFLFEQSRDALVLVLDGGGGYGVAFPEGLGREEDARMTFLYQHPILAGFGIRGRRGAFRFGAHFATGPIFVGARFDTLRTENRVLGMVEGRGRLGWHFGSVTVAASVGYGSLYNQPPQSVLAPFAGGLIAGLEVDWWH